MEPHLKIPCPTCNGTQTTDHEDRHGLTDKDACPTCCGTGWADPGTGTTQGGSYDPERGRAYGDPMPGSGGPRRGPKVTLTGGYEWDPNEAGGTLILDGRKLEQRPVR